MYTRPSVDELLEGVRRTLDNVLIGGTHDAMDSQRVALPMLLVLDRAMSEWPDRAHRLAADSAALRAGASEIAALVVEEPAAEAVEHVVASLPVTPDDADARRLAEDNVALKAALIELMDLLGLPAAPDAPEPVKAADEVLLGVLRSYTDRELAAVPAVDIAEVMGRMEAAAAEGHQDHGDIPERLAAFVDRQLAQEDPEHVVGSGRIENLKRLTGGNSRDTFLFDVLHERTSGRTETLPCVMQREPVSSLLETDAEGDPQGATRRRPEIEFQIVQAMERAGLRVPHMMWADFTGEWLDRAFVVARRESGVNNDYAIRDTDPDAVARLYDDYVETVAKFHDLKVDEIGLDCLPAVRPEEAADLQIDIFERAYRKQALEPHPGVEYIIRWLRAHAPIAEEVSLVHADLRRGNFLVDGDRITSYLDWEQCHLGDPVEDVAFMFWAFWNLEVIMPIDDFVTRYEDLRGIKVDRATLAYYRLFTEFKMIVVGMTGLNSYYATENRQLQYALPYSHTWVTECSQRFLEELATGGPTHHYLAAKDAPLVW